MLSLAAAYLGSDLVSTVLQPVCEKVTKITGEACFVGVLDGQEIVMIAHASTRFPIGLASHVGMRMSAFSTAAGPAAGLLPVDELDALLKAARLKGNTKVHPDPQSQAASDHLPRPCGRYCSTKQEAAIWFCAVAVPLRRVDGSTIGAISIPALASVSPAIPPS